MASKQTFVSKQRALEQIAGLAEHYAMLQVAGFAGVRPSGDLPEQRKREIIFASRDPFLPSFRKRAAHTTRETTALLRRLCYRYNKPFPNPGEVLEEDSLEARAINTFSLTRVLLSGLNTRLNSLDEKKLSLLPELPKGTILARELFPYYSEGYINSARGMGYGISPRLLDRAVEYGARLVFHYMMLARQNILDGLIYLYREPIYHEYSSRELSFEWAERLFEEAKEEAGKAYQNMERQEPDFMSFDDFHLLLQELKWGIERYSLGMDAFYNAWPSGVERPLLSPDYLPRETMISVFGEIGKPKGISGQTYYNKMAEDARHALTGEFLH